MKGSLNLEMTLFSLILYFLLDKQRKEKMRDKFVGSLRSAKEGNQSSQQPLQVDSSPVRRNSFSRRFIEAIFENQTSEASEHKTTENTVQDPTSKTAIVSTSVTTEDEVMFEDVMALPKERKISVMMSIFGRLMAQHDEAVQEDNVSKTNNGVMLDDISEEQETVESGQQNSEKGINNQDNEVITGVDNKAFDSYETQLSPCSPDQISEADVNQDDSKSMPMERVIASSTPDPESAVPPTPGTKTARAWLKDPRLYKVA